MNKSRVSRDGSIFGLVTKVIIYIVFILLFIRCIMWSYGLGHSVFYSTSVDKAPGRDITVNIGRGMNARSTAMYLKERGVIANEFSFVVQSQILGFEIVPGSYTFNTSQTSREILEKIDAGKTDSGE